MPLSFHGYGGYQQYRKNVVLRIAMTSTAAPWRARTVIAMLTGQTQVTAKTLPLSELTFEDGFSSLRSELDKKFGLDNVTLEHNNISYFFHDQRDNSLLIEEFVVGFHSSLDIVSNLEINNEVKGHLLLKQAKLDSHDRNLVVEAAGDDCFLQTPATSLKNAFRSKGLPPASMNTRQPRYCASPTTASANSGNHARQNTRVKVPSRLPSPDNHMFDNYMNTDNLNDVPIAIIDSRSCCSVVERETLKEAMRQLGMDYLKDEQICQRKHHFGPLDKPMKTICAVPTSHGCVMQTRN